MGSPKEYMRQYYLKNKARILKRNRQWDLANKERRTEGRRNWQMKHPEAANIASMKFHKSRRAKLDELKLESGCVDCGYNDHPEALHFDHVRGRKKFNISQSTTLKWETLQKGIDKCEVRCANCHAIVTATRRKSG